MSPPHGEQEGEVCSIGWRGVEAQMQVSKAGLDPVPDEEGCITGDQLV